MDNQLSSISTQYSKFSKGQYVEHTQFNELQDYFEDQDRLSRVMLQGVGIVCGFDPKLIYTNKKATSVLLSQGIAITTDGDLLTLNNKSNTKKPGDDLEISELKTISFDSKEYTHWKPYDNQKAHYPPFYKNEDENQIELWELSTAAEARSGFQALTSFDNLEDKFLFLYLETYEKAVKPCRGIDCDDHGVQLIQNLKVLVTTLAGAEQILMKDNVATHPALVPLQEAKLKRVILTPLTGSLVNLKQAYENVLTTSNYSSMFRNIDMISEIMNIPLSSFNTVVDLLSGQNKNFQYCYAVLNDLTATYAEILKELRKSFSRSLPDVGSFPKHISLGRLVTDGSLDTTRHQFYNSPILDNDKTVQVKLLIDRFKQQIIEFRDPSVIAAVEGIKITPSQDISLLGDKAIPFYYNLTENFLKTWNFDKTRNRASHTNLGYNTTQLSGSLHIDKKSFFRIEGHQGMDYQDVIENISDFKNDNQLGFDIMALSLEQLRGNTDISKAYFTDYVAKHPGLEHLGGVKRGGTFVIVYESENNPAVIADFALPYSCCIPKSDVGLSLPADEICSDSPPLKFNVTPANGVVKAEVNGTVVNGVVKILGQYYFKPQSVDDSWLDKKIGFTVNGKPTNCSLKVLSDLNITVFARNIVHDTSMTTVTFNVSNQNTDDYEYKWDFLGDGKYVVLKPDSQRNVKYTYSEIDPAKPVNVLISGNGCSQVITLTDWYRPQQVETNPPSITSITTDIQGKLYGSGRVTLSSSVTGGDGAVSYKWECNDSRVFISDNLASILVSLPSPGSYTFTLTVKDINNMEDIDSITIVVGTELSVSSITISPQYPTSDDELIATATVVNPDNFSVVSYDWSFDGVLKEKTTSNTKSFGKISAMGSRKIGVNVASTKDGNPFNSYKEVPVTINYPSFVGTSFLEGTLITMGDGSKKAIKDIKTTDVLMSLNNKTVTVKRTIAYDYKGSVYRLNDNEEYFITGSHPVWTTRGWLSFEPEKTKAILPSLVVGQLQVRDTLIKENGQRSDLDTISFIGGEHRVYNIEVDGDVEADRNFFANGYCVYGEIES